MTPTRRTNLRLLGVLAFALIVSTAGYAAEPDTQQVVAADRVAIEAPEAVVAAPVSTIAHTDGFPKVAKKQVRPKNPTANSGCTGGCNCRFDCRIVGGGKDACVNAPAANCKMFLPECESCGPCVCF